MNWLDRATEAGVQGFLVMRNSPPILRKSIGQRFGRLTVRSYAGHRRNQAYANCKCDCGVEKAIALNGIRYGAVRSCGCLHKETAIAQGRANATHGYAKTRVFAIWQGVITRCTNPNRPHWKDYGGRGIRVCDRWMGGDGFVHFLADMGEPSDGMSLERRDNNGDYTPDNCYWLPWSYQAKNRRYNWRVSMDGKEMTAADATRILGIGKDTLASRLRKSSFKKTDCVPLEALLNG